MADKLNDDCWLSILQCLGLEDQLSLSLVSVRLHENVLYNWRHMHKIELTLSPQDVDNALMDEFLECASPTLQELVLRKGSLALLQRWKSHSFPQLHTLRCEMQCIKLPDDYDADSETLLLTQIFPNLTKLSLTSCTTGNHLWQWHKLQELNLIWCEDLDTKTFTRIFSTLQLRKLSILYYGYNVNFGDELEVITKCETLEELVLDEHHLLGTVLMDIMRLLPRLRLLAFYSAKYGEYLLGTLTKFHAKRFKSLLFNDSFWDNERLAEAILPNLQRLVFHEDDIYLGPLYKMCVSMPLKELHLLKMRGLPSATQLWNIVAKCETLEVLNLSGNKLNKSFIKESSVCLERSLSERRKPLQLICNNTEIHPQLIYENLKHPKLEISFSPLKLNTWSSKFIEIEFYEVGKEN